MEGRCYHWLQWSSCNPAADPWCWPWWRAPIFAFGCRTLRSLQERGCRHQRQHCTLHGTLAEARVCTTTDPHLQGYQHIRFVVLCEENTDFLHYQYWSVKQSSQFRSLKLSVCKAKHFVSSNTKRVFCGYIIHLHLLCHQVVCHSSGLLKQCSFLHVMC